MRLSVRPDGALTLPTAVRQRHGLDEGGEVVVEDTGDAIILRSLDQVVSRAQELSRRLLGDGTVASVDDFLSDRARDAAGE